MGVTPIDLAALEDLYYATIGKLKVSMHPLQALQTWLTIVSGPSYER